MNESTHETIKRNDIVRTNNLPLNFTFLKLKRKFTSMCVVSCRSQPINCDAISEKCLGALTWALLLLGEPPQIFP